MQSPSNTSRMLKAQRCLFNCWSAINVETTCVSSVYLSMLGKSRKEKKNFNSFFFNSCNSYIAFFYIVLYRVPTAFVRIVCMSFALSLSLPFRYCIPRMRIIRGGIQNVRDDLLTIQPWKIQISLFGKKSWF